MKSSKKLILINIVFLLFFCAILFGVLQNGFLTKLDSSVNLFITNLRSSFLTSLSKFIDIVFDSLPILIVSLIISLILWLKHSKKEGIMLAFGLIVSLAAVIVIKLVVHRLRPSNAIISASGFSFPSGHSVTSVVFFGLMIFIIIPKIRSVIAKCALIGFSVFMILLIGFTRAYLSVHWLTDVLAGFCLGLFILTGSILIKRKFDK